MQEGKEGPGGRDAAAHSRGGQRLSIHHTVSNLENQINPVMVRRARGQVRRGPGRKVRGRGQVDPLRQRFAMRALVTNVVPDSGAPQEPSCANPTGGLVSFSCGLLVISLLRSSWSCDPVYSTLWASFLFFWFMFLCFLLIFLSFCRCLRPCP